MTRISNPNRTVRRWLASVTLAAIFFILSLVGVEVALRVFDLAPAGGVATVTEREFGRVPGIYAPNQRLTDLRIPALPHEVSINELGYRGESFPLVKDSAEFRLVVIGDSFVYGDYVDDDKTLPAFVGAQLATRCKNVRVVNAGLGGSTITEQIQLAQRALRLSPDMMVLVFSENDLSDLAQPTTMWEQLAQNRAAKSRFPLGTVYPVLRNTALWNLALKVRGTLSNREVERNLQKARSSPESNKAAQPGAATLVPGDYAARYRNELIALQGVGTKHNVPILLAAYPSHLTLAATRPPDLIRWITETGRAAGLPTMDLSPVLLGAGRQVQDLYLLPHDGHPSPAGYSLAAQVIADSVAEHSRLIGRCTN